MLLPLLPLSQSRLVQCSLHMFRLLVTQGKLPLFCNFSLLPKDFMRFSFHSSVDLSCTRSLHQACQSMNCPAASTESSRWRSSTLSALQSTLQNSRFSPPPLPSSSSCARLLDLSRTTTEDAAADQGVPLKMSNKSNSWIWCSIWISSHPCVFQWSLLVRPLAAGTHLHPQRSWFF